MTEAMPWSEELVAADAIQPRLMRIRQAVYQNLKSILLSHGSHQLLHQFEHGHDVPLVMPPHCPVE